MQTPKKSSKKLDEKMLKSVSKSRFDSLDRPNSKQMQTALKKYAAVLEGSVYDVIPVDSGIHYV